MSISIKTIAANKPSAPPKELGFGAAFSVSTSIHYGSSCKNQFRPQISYYLPLSSPDLELMEMISSIQWYDLSKASEMLNLAIPLTCQYGKKRIYFEAKFTCSHTAACIKQS